MDFLVADGGEGGDHHVKAVEPRPAFNEVKACGSHGGEHNQRRGDDLQVAQGFHAGSFKFRVSSFKGKKAVSPVGP
jgi:hypothetical protein